MQIKKIQKQGRFETIRKMKDVIGIHSHKDLAADLGIDKQIITNYTIRGDGSFYQRIIEFGIKHNLSLDWLFGEKTLASAGKSSIKAKASVVADTLGEYLAEDELYLLKAYRALAATQKEHVINTIKILGEGKGSDEARLKKNHEG